MLGMTNWEMLKQSVPVGYIRLYKIVDDPSLDSIISWGESGNSFIIWEPKVFRRKIIPRLLCDNMSMVFQWLKENGFKKVEASPQLEFGNEDFVRGQPERLMMVFSKSSWIRVKELKKRIAADKKKVLDRMQHLRI